MLLKTINFIGFSHSLETLSHWILTDDIPPKTKEVLLHFMIYELDAKGESYPLNL